MRSRSRYDRQQHFVPKNKAQMEAFEKIAQEIDRRRDEALKRMGVKA
jgi:hypothetical protein